MFCDVKLHFSQLLTAHVLTVAILGIYLSNEKVPSSEKNNILEYK